MLDAKLCRTCQKVVDKNDGSSKLDEVDPGTEITLRTKLHVCVPEMMLADSNEDFICMICTNMLNLSYMFRNICIKTEQTRHNSVPILELNTKIKKEAILDDTGIIVTRLQNPTMKMERRSSRSSPAAASVANVVNEVQSPKVKKSDGVARDKKRRSRPSKSCGKMKNSSRNVVGVEDMNGIQDDSLIDANNQEPLLEIAYEESIVASDIDRFSSASDYSLGSLRDIPEVIVRDPNMNTAPGGRTLRTRHNVSYAMPPDSPETVQKHKQTSVTPSSMCGGAEKTATGNSTSGNNAVNSGGVDLAVGSDGVGNKGRRGGGATANGGRGKGASASGGVYETKQALPGHKYKLQTNASLADVNVIDDFCRTNNRDPLEFLCSVPLLKCNADIGQAAPPRGIMPVIDNIQCDLCGLQLCRYHSLRRHRMRHFANYKYCCVFCGRNAYERYEMKEHLEQRHNLKPGVVQIYIENSLLNNSQTNAASYRILHSKHALTCSSDRHTTNNISFNIINTSQPQQRSKRNRPRTKSKEDLVETITYNRPGPKSSKITMLIENISSKSGPKINKAKASMEMQELNSIPKGPKISPRLVQNARNVPANIHLELKRRRMNIGSTPVVSVKRKRVAQSTTAGARFKYECIFCDILVSDKESLRAHLKHYHCNVCFKFFVGKSTKNAHHCLHVPQKVEDENFYLCLDCDDYKAKGHFQSHLEPSIARKLDQLFTLHPRPTYDSHSADEKSRIVPTINCNLGKNNQECFFFCGDPDELQFHQARVHGLTKLLQQISPEKLKSFEDVEKQIRPAKVQSQVGSSQNLPALLHDMQLVNYVEDFVDVGALDARDADVDSMADVGIERCSTCAEEMPNGPLEHECVAPTLVDSADPTVAAPAEELYKCEICLNSFDRLSLIEHMKVHMKSAVL